MRIITPYFQNEIHFSNELRKLYDDTEQSIWLKNDSPDYSNSPDADIFENNDHYHMSVDLPGLTKEDIKIELANDLMTITGERKKYINEKNLKILRSERQYGQFKIVFSLPNSVNQSIIEARYENGVLDVALPKVQTAKPKQIEIQNGKSGFLDRLISGTKPPANTKDDVQ